MNSNTKSQKAMDNDRTRPGQKIPPTSSHKGDDMHDASDSSSTQNRTNVSINPRITAHSNAAVSPINVPRVGPGNVGNYSQIHHSQIPQFSYGTGQHSSSLQQPVLYNTQVRNINSLPAPVPPNPNLISHPVSSFDVDPLAKPAHHRQLQGINLSLNDRSNVSAYQITQAHRGHLQNVENVNVNAIHPTQVQAAQSYGYVPISANNTYHQSQGAAPGSLTGPRQIPPPTNIPQPQVLLQRPQYNPNLQFQQNSYAQQAQHRSIVNGPLYKLSMNLIDTYRTINHRYYAAKDRSRARGDRRRNRNNNGHNNGNYKASSLASNQPNTEYEPSNIDNSNIQSSSKLPGDYASNNRQNQVPYLYSVTGHSRALRPENLNYVEIPGQAEDYPVAKDEIWRERYQIMELLGKGSYGQVVKALDMQSPSESRKHIAIKIIKNKRAFHQQALSEVEILDKILRNDPHDRMNIVRYLDQFYHRGHLCLVFELLSFSLFTLLENTDFRGVSLALTRNFADQIFKALDFLYVIGVIHCDLKPENILLVDAQKSRIKLIDFGSSCNYDNRPYQYIQSRFYRSPEVLLNLPYDMAIDMWSLGCILIEMHTGDPLFPGSHEIDQMYKIIEVLDMPPDSMIRQSRQANKFFQNINGSWRPKNDYYSSHNYHQPGTRRLEQIIQDSQTLSYIRTSTSDIFNFKLLVHRMLEFKPDSRISVRHAKQHPFMVRTSDSFTTTDNESQQSSNGDGNSGNEKSSGKDGDQDNNSDKNRDNDDDHASGDKDDSTAGASNSNGSKGNSNKGSENKDKGIDKDHEQKKSPSPENNKEKATHFACTESNSNLTEKQSAAVPIYVDVNLNEHIENNQTSKPQNLNQDENSSMNNLKISSNDNKIIILPKTSNSYKVSCSLENTSINQESLLKASSSHNQKSNQSKLVSHTKEHREPYLVNVGLSSALVSHVQNLPPVQVAVSSQSRNIDRKAAVLLGNYGNGLEIF